MSSAVEALRSIADDLERHGGPWALVGGFAVSARAEPRFTRDVDVAVAVADDRAAEQTVRSLTEQGYRPLIAVATPADIALAREAVDIITARGFARGRDLRTALDEVIPG